MPEPIALLAFACIVGIGLLHWFLSRAQARWPGAVVPVLWVVLVITAALAGRIDSVSGYVVAGIALLVLARMWSQGRETVHARREAAPSR